MILILLPLNFIFNMKWIFIGKCYCPTKRPATGASKYTPKLVEFVRTVVKPCGHWIEIYQLNVSALISTVAF